MDGFPLACAVSFAVVFVAELGDKSQLMALTFATRYRTLPVLVGITVATAVVHLLSVAVGHSFGAALPAGWISLAAAVAFLGFGAWSLRGDTLSAAERGKAARSGGSAVVAASVAFFLAELGDKTMLATITLATQYGWFGVWLGSTVGMVAADALAIVVGRQLGRMLPERAVRVGSAVLFFGFGAWLALEAINGLTAGSLLPWLDHHAAGWIALGIAVLATAAGLIGRLRRRHLREGGPAPAVWTARVLFVLATVLGLAAPLLVAADVIDPIAVFDDPGVVVVGAGLALLGVALVLAAPVGAGPAFATRGLHARVRNPGLTGMVVATAGTLFMVPTVIAVLGAVLLVVAVQVQVRGVREPLLARLHGESYAQYAARTGRFLPRVLPPDDVPAGLRDAHRARVG